MNHRAARIVFAVSISSLMTIVMFLLMLQAGTSETERSAGENGGRDPRQQRPFRIKPRVSQPVLVGPRDRNGTAEQEDRSFGLKPGTLVVYEARFGTQTTLGFDRATGESALLEFQGELECLSYPSPESGKLLLGYRFSSVEFRNEHGPIAARLSADMIDGLAQEVLVETSRRGQIETFFFPAAMSPAARNQMRAFLNAVQIVWPPVATSRWETVEADMTGRYRARYIAKRRPPRQLLIQKSKVSYELVQAKENGVSLSTGARVLPTGVTEAVVDSRKGSLISLQQKAQLEIRGHGPWNGVKVRTDVRLERRSMSRGRTAASGTRQEVAARLANMIAARPDEADDSEFAQEEISHPETGNGGARHSVTDLGMQLLRLVESGAEREREAYELVCRLATLIARKDGNAWAVADLIRSGRVTGAAQNFLAGALGSAGTSAAQAVLADLLLEDGFEEGFRSSCLVALATTKEPSEKAEWVLRALAVESEPSGVDRNALLVLGVMADRLRDANSLRQIEIARFLMDREAPLLAAGHIETLLAALGNAGVNESYPVIEKYLHDPDNSTRAAAVSALKRLEHARIDDHLRNAFRDQSSAVRLAAIETLGDRPITPDLLEAIGKTALLDQEDRLRRAAIVFLGDRVASADSRSILERVSSQEPLEDLRRLAQDYLADEDA